MNKVAVINCSPSVYNLGVARIANYHRARGDEVHSGRWGALNIDERDTREMDKFYFSAIFTWNIRQLVMAVNMVRNWGKEVEIGGPAPTFMAKYVEAQTGITPHRGIDQRFEYVDGEYELTFTSRGCPHSCAFCGVKKVEPFFVQYDTFPLAAMVGDNNILATPMSHQRRVVERLATLGKEIDFNSGFDMRFFQEKHYRLYSQLRLECWRFAFDSMAVEKDVRRVAGIMARHGLDRHQVTFYCLVGFPGQTIKDCLYRLNTIIKLRMNPYPMRFIPLNSLNHNYVAPGWTEELLQRITAYYQTPHAWMAVPWEEYKPGKTKKGRPEEQGCLDSKS